MPVRLSLASPERDGKKLEVVRRATLNVARPHPFARVVRTIGTSTRRTGPLAWFAPAATQTLWCEPEPEMTLASTPKSALAGVVMSRMLKSKITRATSRPAGLRAPKIYGGGAFDSVNEANMILNSLRLLIEQRHPATVCVGCS